MKSLRPGISSSLGAFFKVSKAFVQIEWIFDLFGMTDGPTAMRGIRMDEAKVVSGRFRS
jgi:hypothetical protein